MRSLNSEGHDVGGTVEGFCSRNQICLFGTYSRRHRLNAASTLENTVLSILELSVSAIRWSSEQNPLNSLILIRMSVHLDVELQQAVLFIWTANVIHGQNKTFLIVS